MLPEAYAAISVRAVVGLLRLKSNPTPVIVLRNCVTDAGAAELEVALREYGEKADVQALEFPHNAAMTGVAVQHIANMAARKGSSLEEIDLSYNPQLGDTAILQMLPLLKPKASKLNTLRLGDCSLSKEFLKQLGTIASQCHVKLLDLSYNSFRGCGEELATVCEAPILEELILTCCELSVADITRLAEDLPYTSLKSLQLGGNRFGNAGLLALTEHLPACQIDELGLEGNGIDTAGLDALGTAWAKRPFARLRLNGNKLTQAEISDFVYALKSLHS